MGQSSSKSKSTFIKEPPLVPSQETLKKPKIIRRIPNQQRVFIHNRPYLNTFQVLTGLSSVAFFVAVYYWINRKETSVKTSYLSRQEVESIYDQAIRAFEERKANK